MSVAAWTTHPDNSEIEILNVPAYSEKDSENECLVHCLRMVINYAATCHPNSWINEGIAEVSSGKVREYLTINRSGWVPDQDELDNLAADIGPIKFNHRLERQSPTEETFYRIIRSHLDNDIPVIPVINVKKLRRGVKAGVHAVVAVGMNDETIAINDPWGHPYDLVDRKDFIEAWNDTVNQFITIELGGQQSLQRNAEIGGEGK